MSRHYRMLQKAKLADELFNAEEPARPLLSTADEPAERTEEIRALTPEPQPPEPIVIAEAAVAKGPAAAAPPLWRESLAEVLSSPQPRDCRIVALCPLTGMSSAAETAAAVALWIADSGGGPTLIVEANYAHPTLARVLPSRKLGLCEAVSSSDAPQRFIQGTHREDVKVMPAGRRPARAERQAWGAGVSEILDSLIPTFNQIVIELPPPRQPEFNWLKLKRTDLLLLGVMRPTRSKRGGADFARRELDKAEMPLSGVLLAQKFSTSDAIRMERLARQFDRPAATQAAAG